MVDRFVDAGRGVRLTVRGWRRRPVLTLVAASALAIGLSAGVAVFTYVNGFFQPFPGVDGRGLVRVFGVRDDDPYRDLSYLDYVDYAAGARAFRGLAAAQAGYAASVRHETMTEVAFLEAVSGSYFPVLGVEMGLGRALTPDDDRPGAPAAAVLSHAWWVRSFGGDRGIVGSTVYLNFRPYTVVGVAPPDFLGSMSSYRPDAWVPFAPFRDRYTGWSRQAEDRDAPLVRVFGRLRENVGGQRALDDLRSLAGGLDDLYPGREGRRSLRLGRATWIDPRARESEMPLVRVMVLGASGLLLLVAANVGNLVLAVLAGRERELAVQAALGASRGRLVRQVVGGNVLLALAAGAVALLLAHPAAARLGSYFASPSVWGANVAREVAVDLQVAAFAVAVSVATGCLAALLPALRASRRDLVAVLKTDAAGSVATGGRRRWRRPGLQDVLVTVQAGLSVVLLVVAGLVLRALTAASGREPGFAHEDLVASYVSTSSTAVTVAERDRWFRDLASRLEEESWVRSATVADAALLSPHGTGEMRIDGVSEASRLTYSRVAPGFFAAVGIPLREGRWFAASDTAGAPGVAVVSEAFARRYAPGGSALGRRIWWPASAEDGREFEIVGTVSDVRVQDFLADHEPVVFFSYPQHGYPSGSALMVATTIDPGAAVPRLEGWLRDYEPHVAIVNVLPYTEVVRGFLYPQRMNAELFTALAVLGLVVAAAGIFGVQSLAVSRQTREIGIRVAIGAESRHIAALVLRQALAPVAAGVVLGLGVAVALGGTIGVVVREIGPADPVTLALGPMVLVATAGVAAYLPMRRALRVEPVRALRQE